MQMEVPAAEGPLQLAAENQRLTRELHALRQFIDALENLTEAVEHPKGEGEVMDLLTDILGNARQTIRAKDGSLLVLDEDSGELSFVLSQGAIPQEQLAWRRLPPGKGIAGWVVENRRATIVNDAQMDDRFYAHIDEELHFKTRSILAAPIIGGGQVLGVIEVLNKEDEEPFTVDDQTLLTLMCRYAGELLHTLIQQDKQQLSA